MALFYDIVFNKDSRRHEIEFVNQQFDYLMGIYYDVAAGTYRLSLPLEEARAISKSWGGRDFDLDYWLKLAQQELTEHDLKYPNGKEENS
ncbi:MAG: hypothetical protein KF775_05770 [Cyclobacteriaceae bacterium]|nr:hypothetical protein [Cytophagales bacterium]MBX2899133.1 hypothetical protein [Cyclobacteriaceae bacterium]